MDVIGDIGRAVLWSYMVCAPFISLILQGMYDVDRTLRHKYYINGGLKFLNGKLWEFTHEGAHWLFAISWAIMSGATLLFFSHTREDVELGTYLLYVSNQLSIPIGCIVLLAIPLLMWKAGVFIVVKLYVARNK